LSTKESLITLITMTAMTNAPIIPNDYIIRRSGDQVGGKRKLTVRKFSTTQIFQREEILQGLAKSSLVFGTEFGVIKTFPTGMLPHDADKPEPNIRALCGLVGESNLVLLNAQNELDYIRLQNVLRATLMIEFMADPDSNQLEFLIYGGTQGRL
jgi:hypothetical protein